MILYPITHTNPHQPTPTHMMQRTTTGLILGTIMLSATASLLLGASLQGKQCVEFNLPFKVKIAMGETCQPGR
jgi:hypothetical protein